MTSFSHIHIKKSWFMSAVSPSNTHTHTRLHRFLRLIGCCRPELKGDSCFLRQLSQQLLLTVIALHLHTPSSKPVRVCFLSPRQTSHAWGGGWGGGAQWCRSCFLTPACLHSCFISAVNPSWESQQSHSCRSLQHYVMAEDGVELHCTHAHTGFPVREVQWWCVQRFVITGRGWTRLIGLKHKMQ